MSGIHTHVQSTASSTWNIVHNLGVMAPVVDVYVTVDGQMSKILPKAVTVISNTTVQVTFSEPRVGTAAIR